MKRVRYWVEAVWAGACVMMLVTPAIAQPAGYLNDLAGERVALKFEIDRLRSGLATKGDATVLAAERGAKFQISNEPIPGPWAGTDQSTGDATIFMTAEFSLLVTYLADADIISVTTPDFSQCNQAYGRAVFESLASNFRRIALGQTPLRLLAPEVFLGSVSGDCRRFLNRFPIHSDLVARRDANVRSIYLWMYLHELGHLALGHNAINLETLAKLPPGEKRMEEFKRLMARSRAQETDADDWATDRINDLLPNPLSALTSLLPTFYVAVGGLNCIYAEGSTHPTGFLRFSRQVGRLKDRAIKAGKFSQDPKAAELIEEARSLAARMQKDLACK